MSKKIGLTIMILLLTFSVSLGSIFAQGASVAVSQIYHPPGESCITNPYFELHGFLPNAQIYVESLHFSEISCETHVNNTNSWPRTRYAMTDQNGYVLFPIFTGGVSGTYTMRFSDDVNSVTITFSTNENGDLIAGQSVPVVPQSIVPTEVVVQPPQSVDSPMPAISEKWCAVQRFDTNPASDHFEPGTQVSMYGKGGDCRFGNNGLPRATRYSIDGQLFGEKQQSENYDTWDISRYAQGTHTICFMVASDRDTTWEHRDEQCRTYTIGSAVQPSQQGNTNPPVVSNECPEALPALVQPGSIAIVNTLSSDNLNVRSSPHVSKETKIDQLAPLSTFTVVSGPVCAEGYRWWQIGYNGKSGYAAEAGARAYNFVPNGTALPYDPTHIVNNTPPVVVLPNQPANPADPMPLSYTEMYTAPFTTCNSSGVTQQNATVLLVDTGFSDSNADCDASVGGLITNGFSWGGVETDPNASSTPIQMTPWAEIIQKYTADENGMVRIDVAIDVNGYARAVATAKEVIPFGILDNLKKLGAGIYGLVTSENVIAELINKTNEFGDSLSKTQVWSKGDFSLQAYVWTAGGEQRIELTGSPLHYVFPYTYGKTTNTLYWNAPSSVVLLSITVPVSAGQTLDVHTGLSLVAHSYGPVGTYISQDKSYVQAIVFTKVK